MQVKADSVSIVVMRVTQARSSRGQAAPLGFGYRVSHVVQPLLQALPSGEDSILQRRIEASACNAGIDCAERLEGFFQIERYAPVVSRPQGEIQISMSGFGFREEPFR